MRYARTFFGEKFGDVHTVLSKKSRRVFIVASDSMRQINNNQITYNQKLHLNGREQWITFVVEQIVFG